MDRDWCSGHTSGMYEHQMRKRKKAKVKKREKEIENNNLEPWLTYKMPGTFKSALLKDTFYL